MVASIHGYTTSCSVGCMGVRLVVGKFCCTCACKQSSMSLRSHAITVVCPYSCCKERLRLATLRSNGYICHLATSYVIANYRYKSICCGYFYGVEIRALCCCRHSALSRLADSCPAQYLRQIREQTFTASCVLCNTKVFVQHKTSPLPIGAEASSSKVGAAGQRMAGRTYLKQ